MDLGSGDDRVQLYDGVSATTIATGEGRDTVGLFLFYKVTDATPVITDFAAGADGDRLGLTDFLGEELTHWRGSGNPFARGFIRLVQEGVDTVIEVAADDRPGHDYVPLVRLEHVDAGLLTAENLSGFNPDGSRTPGLRVDDVPGWVRFYGTTGADRIHGGDGDDEIEGDVGNDRIWGDAGSDYLVGGAGDDRVFGGDGNDHLRDDGGSNYLDGGAGDDFILLQVGAGTGGGRGDEAILGGSGDDYVRHQNFRSGSLTVDLGDGIDHLELYTIQDGGTRITTGAGRDLVTVRGDFASALLAPIEITDFTPGWGGDRLDIGGWLRAVAADWNGSDDPFALGFLHLEDVGDATLVVADRDGPGGSAAPVTMARLDGVEASMLTTANFEGFDPAAAMFATSVDHARPSLDGDWMTCLV